MTIAVRAGHWPGNMTDEEAISALRDFSLKALDENTRSSEELANYQALRITLLEHPEFRDLAPSFIKGGSNFFGIRALMSEEAKEENVRRDELAKGWIDQAFAPLFKRADDLKVADAIEATASIIEEGDTLRSQAELGPLPDERRSPSSSWTGLTTARERIVAIQIMFPPALDAIEGLINKLEEAGHNGGPPLDELSLSLTALRELHKALGALLALADDGYLGSDKGQGAIIEIAKFAERFAKLVKDDPVRFGVAGMIAGVASLIIGPAALVGAGVSAVLNAKRP